MISGSPAVGGQKAGPLGALALSGNKLPVNQQPLTAEQYFQKWNESGNNDALKSELLDRLIGDNALKLDCVRKKPDLLNLLHQAFESNTPLVYEKATIVTSDLVDSKWVQA